MRLDDLTDADIQELIRMPKWVINPGAKQTKKLKHIETNFDLECIDGKHKFSLYVRQSSVIQNSFSCGLTYIFPSREKVTLTRYNGSDHDHRNRIERTMAAGCHIHVATERYIKKGAKTEGYASQTTDYNDVAGALRLLIFECSVSGFPDSDEGNQLF